MVKKLELLAPARDLECGKAAIEHGADAVYIGAPRFGARSEAGNSVGDIGELCGYAHRFGAKVYVTVNTIIYDGELEATKRLLGELESAGVDAVLVQDMSVLRMLHECGMEAHASTQTDNRTAAKVGWLRSAGFSRVVLARELSADEIAAIHAAVPDVELEVFVHGALCVSYSGQCYASQHCFGRSANRGECAQFCRLKFGLEDAAGRNVASPRYFLSLKDMNRIDSIERLAASGATSFKIEGRLKNADYVKNVTAAYSERLDEIVRRHPGEYRRASFGECRYAFTPNLAKTFNRGYTQYFVDGRQPGIDSMDTPKAKGEFVGRVKEMRRSSFTVSGVSSFANGDGLCYVGDGGVLEGFRVNKVENNRLYPLRMPAGLLPGAALYRNNDQDFERKLAGQSAVRKIKIGIALKPTGAGFKLEAHIYGGPMAEVDVAASFGEAHTDQRQNIERQLAKLGATIYECECVDIPEGFSLFIPSSVLASARRQLVSKLEEATIRYVISARKKFPDIGVRFPKGGTHDYLYNVSNAEAARFYSSHGLDVGVSAFELHHPDGALLMQCRHCLRYAFGFCERHGGQKPTWKEPLRLTLPDGRRFRLEFDCRHCQMNVYADGRIK